MRKRRRHRNPNGHWCNCPWGSAQLNDPIDDLWDVEKYGSEKVAWVKESAKLDWLRGRPDMQEPHHQRFLDHLEANHPEHDNLYPWLARERKKGRLHFTDTNNEEARLQRGYAVPDRINFVNHDGRQVPLEDDHLETLQDWMKYKKQAKQGVDIMQHHVGDAIHEADKWDGAGETLHESTNHPGWTVKLLRNRRDLRKEGERMNHCLGGMNYHQDQARGEGAFYSVRDPHNNPHASLELRRDYGAEDAADPRNPLYQHYSQGDYYGESDGPVPWQAQEVMDEFMGPRGHSLEPSEHEEEEEEFEPWWDEYYQIDGPANENDWIAHTNDEYEEENRPDEYERAHQDAYENDLEGPDLYVGDPDVNDIWDDFEWNHTRNPVDPHRVQEMFKTMDDHGYGDEWRERAQNWLDENYKPYLDPYGTSPEWNPQKQDQFSDPHAPSQGTGELMAPGTPGSYYPGRANPNDEHFARNLEYHLFENRAGMDEEGEPISPDRMERMYPGESAGHDPKYREDVPEETGKPKPYRINDDFRQRNHQQNFLNDTEEGRMNWPTDSQGTQPPRFHHPGEGGIDNPWEAEREPPHSGPVIPEDAYGRGRRWSPVDDPYKRDLPQPYRGDPAMWEEGGNTKFHQLPIPQMQQDAPQPGHVNEYFRGEQQGRIFPKSWYFDRMSGYGRPTDLPPHLFPPERYAWQDLQVHPQQMPMWSAMTAYTPGQYGMENQQPPGAMLPGQQAQSWDLTRGEISTGVDPMAWNNETSQYEDRMRFPQHQQRITPGTHPTVPWQASYHPRDDEEWVDEDEPDFSATIPEPRWGSNTSQTTD